MARALLLALQPAAALAGGSGSAAPTRCVGQGSADWRNVCNGSE